MRLLCGYLGCDMRRYYGGKMHEMRVKLSHCNIPARATNPYNQALLMPQSCRKPVKFCAHALSCRELARKECAMNNAMKIQIAGKARTRLKAALALGALAVMLSGCVVYPSNGYYGGGYGYYAPAPAYYAPPVAFDFDFGRGGGWGHHWH